MKLTIGRIVHYRDPTYGCLAAMVIGFEDLGALLAVFHPSPMTASERLLYRLAFEGEGEHAWHWPERVEE